MTRSGSETKQTRCVHCGRTATRMNENDQPVCKDHTDREPKEIGCPECGFSMSIKEGRYGYFWGCDGYPGCEKTLSIKKSLQMDEYVDDDIEVSLE
ncbi:MAG: topoisomerase DNA-binding C4 zinc finger domain-containing protein [Candidatus Nanohaloarchaeota archaeon QJJ-5]|nr:topoisomerase DNA-binding C4 zinc finger domain-containing protein [Candidatus Nanohaloarchaeota archaeon QJJ-5]